MRCVRNDSTGFKSLVTGCHLIYIIEKNRCVLFFLTNVKVHFCYLKLLKQTDQNITPIEPIKCILPVTPILRTIRSFREKAAWQRKLFGFQFFQILLKAANWLTALHQLLIHLRGQFFLIGLIRNSQFTAVL